MIFIPYSLRSKPRFNLTSIKGWVREWINFFILRKTPLHFCDWCSKLFIKKKDGLELWCRCYKCECELQELREDEARSDYLDDLKAQYCELHPEECEEKEDE